MKLPNQYNRRRLNVDNLYEFEEIAKIHLSVPSLWLENYSFDETEIQDTINDLVTKHKSGNAFCYVYEDGSIIISFIWAQINTFNPEILEIISLWTNEKYRKQGLATSLKNILEMWARENNQIKKISTMVSTKNKAMLELNEKLGYQITSYNMLKLLN